jgi:hypothetical protein
MKWFLKIAALVKFVLPQLIFLGFSTGRQRGNDYDRFYVNSQICRTLKYSGIVLKETRKGR